jgi:hypothetical protein
MAEVFGGWGKLLGAYQHIVGSVPELQLNVVEGPRRKLYWRWIYERNAVNGLALVLSDSYGILPKSIEDAAEFYDEGQVEGAFFRLGPSEAEVLELWFRTALILGYYRLVVNIHKHRFGDYYVYNHEVRRTIRLVERQRHQFATLADVLAETIVRAC